MYKPITLPYPLDALEPYYSKETLELHYEILYKGYVNKLNKVEEKLQKARQDNDFENIKCLEKELAFQGSGKILHELFFLNLGPKDHSIPSRELFEQIQKDFGSFDKFKNQFNAASTNVEGSGWGLLVWVNNLHKLEILQCEKHQNLTLWGCSPLLAVDVWEHSYYLQYKTDKDKYMNAIWEIINWDVVNEIYSRIKSQYQ